MTAKLEDLTDEQFKEWVDRMLMEAERREIVVQGTRPVYRKPMNGPVLSALMKMQRKVWELGKNEVHKTRDLDLNPSESSNLSSLRQAGLIAPSREKKSGWWLITRKGGQFLRGEIPIAAAVHTMANHPIKNQPPEPMYYLHEFKMKPYTVQQYQDYLADMNLHVTPARSAQQSLL